MSEDSAPVINIEGDSVALGPLQRGLIPIYQAWNNSIATSRTLGLSWPTTLEQETAIYDQRVADPRAVYFTVYERHTRRPIGIAYLYEIEMRHARASFGISIGESADRGSGYGTEATRLLLDYAFTAYGLENVMLTVLSFNKAGIRAYEKAGFRIFGRRRKCSRAGSRLFDLIHMECLAGEFQSPLLSEHLDEPGDTGQQEQESRN